MPLGLQLLVPLVLLTWLAAKPPSSRIGFALLVFATGTWLLAIALCGVWTFLPWWTPRLLAALLLATAAWRGLTTRASASSSGATARIGAIACIAIATIALLAAATALVGRKAPRGPIAEIASPFRDGTFLVVNGGSHAIINAHQKTLSTDEPRYRAWRGQSHGVDLIGIDARGLRAPGLLPAEPSGYVGFGTALVAPCDGIVVRAVDGIRDNQVPKSNREQMAGNHVTVRCDGFDIVLAHLRQGSVAVSEGDAVTAGKLLGELGNSGNSDEPHLHLHAQQVAPPGDTFSPEPVPLRIDGRFPVRNDRLNGAALRRGRR